MTDKRSTPSRRQRGDAEVLFGVLLIGLFFGGVLFIADRFSSYQCSNFQEMTGRTTKYLVLDACYVSTPEGWQRYDEYRSRAAASEGLKGIAK